MSTFNVLDLLHVQRMTQDESKMWTSRRETQNFVTVLPRVENNSRPPLAYSAFSVSGSIVVFNLTNNVLKFR